MSAENPSQGPSPQEAFRGVSHEKAVKEFAMTVGQAAMGTEAGYQPVAPVLSERHGAALERTMVGDHGGTTLEAKRSDVLADRDESWRSLEVTTTKTGPVEEGTALGKRFDATEIAVDARSGKAIETGRKHGKKINRTPSTRRLMAATRLMNHKYGLKEDETKAA